MLALSIAALAGSVIAASRYVYNYGLDRRTARHARGLF